MKVGFCDGFCMKIWKMPDLSHFEIDDLNVKKRKDAGQHTYTL